MKVRLNKFLSEAGVASRRQADRWILEGRVSVNRRIVDELGVKVDEDQDVVQVDGKTVRKESRFICVLLNKPVGYLVTLADPFHRPTVRDLLPAGLGRIFPVGRLDFQSEGALLLTNDGELAYRLTHPRFGVRKTYVAKVRGQPDEKALRRLERGVLVEGKKTAPAKAVLLTANPKSSRLRIELSEGRKREVREMCRAVGHPVLELRRIAFAGLGVKPLKPGEWRHLEPREVRRLKKRVELA
ncbi:MAG: rRNA pseudouridine synthase [Candidatus Aminicenantes bacterium]|nr:rRNA pseudouridine synthase [Candidatus Aminicenantes bacterium]